MEIPQGALAMDTVITITPDNTVPAMASNFTNAGPAIDFGPSGLKFLNPVTIAVPYKSGSDLSRLKLLSYTGDGWENVLDITIDSVRGLV